MNRMLSNTARLTALAIAVSLAACGGGGGDPAMPTTPAAPVTPATPAVVLGDLLMDANQPSAYLVGSPEKKNFDELNRIRVAGGFGAMQYEEVVNKAAAAHTQYVVAGGYFGHIEEVGRPGFTGVTVQDRCNAAAGGFTNLVCDEGGYLIGSPSLSDFNFMSQFSRATGHLQSALNYQSNRGGLAVVAFNAPGTFGGAVTSTPSVMGFINMGNIRNAAPRLASANAIVGIYPFDGMTGVGTGFGDGRINILAQYPAGATAAITSFTLRKEGATADTPARIHAAGTYNGTEPTDAGWAILLPTVQLDVNSKYTVTFSGMLNGVDASKTWSFTTGTSPYTRMGG